MKSIMAAAVLIIAASLGSQAVAAAPLVDLHELTAYWLPAEAVIAPETSPSADEGAPSDSALVEILIGSDGRVSQAHVVEYSPEDSNPEWARQVATQMTFKPAPENTARTPVTTRLPVSAIDVDAVRIDGSSDEAMHASVTLMLASLPDQQKVLLQTALLQLSIDDIGSVEELRERFPDMNPRVEFLRERIDGMTMPEILAEAEAASRKEGAPQMSIQGPEPASTQQE